jgi:glucosyl-3-phosphoglycerate synthase
VTILEQPRTVADLAEAKRVAGLTVSVCIPARDESATVGRVVARAGRWLVDEVVVVDDGSNDGTAQVAQAAGARVVGRRGVPGKGSAMAEALRRTAGDLIVFLDADVRNFGGHVVPALLEPLLLDPSVVMAKAAYVRPLDGRPHEGGRVTELLARPLIERLFPELVFLRQPLAGEVAIRRSALEGITLEPGYGVEIGMLLDVARRFGAKAICEVDLGERIHRNRPLTELGAQAREVLDAILARAALPYFAGQASRVSSTVTVDSWEAPPL